MTTEQITTTHDKAVLSLSEQMEALQEKMQTEKAAQAEEIADVLLKRRDAVIISVEDLNDLLDPESEAWELIGKADCIGMSIVLKDGEEGEPPVITRALLVKTAPKAARKSGGGTGSRRDLEGEFRAVASPEQIAWFDTHKEANKEVGRGVRWGFMDRVTKNENPHSVNIPSS